MNLSDFARLEEWAEDAMNLIAYLLKDRGGELTCFPDEIEAMQDTPALVYKSNNVDGTITFKLVSLCE